MNEPARSVPGFEYQFKKPEYLKEALTPRSRSSLNYERLEFLGDSVLNLVVTSRLYHSRPEDNEGGAFIVAVVCADDEVVDTIAIEIADARDAAPDRRAGVGLGQDQP